MTQLRILLIFSFAVLVEDVAASRTNVDTGEARRRLPSPRAWLHASGSPGSDCRVDDGRHRGPAVHAADSLGGAHDLSTRVTTPRDVVGAGVNLTTAERTWLARLPVLRVGIDPTATPLSFVGRDGRASGLAVDYLHDALDLLGLRHITVVTTDWPDTVRRATSGDIDLLASASPANEALSKRFDFSEPYVVFPVMIVTREDTATITGPGDLEGHRVAANMSQGAVASAVRRLTMVEVIDVRHAADGMDAVAMNRADAFVGDIATAEYLIRRDYPARLKLAAATDQRAELAIAVDRHFAALIPLLDRALASVTERRAQTIRNTWLRSEYTWGGSWREIARKAGPPGVAVLVLLLIVSYAYLRLRREARYRRRHEAQLAEATRVAEAATEAKSQFLATMSHEIRTPMHGLIGMLEMLRDTSMNENQRHLLRTAETSAEALLQILNDVLDFSRIEAGRVDIELSTFDLRSLIDGVIELFSRQTRQKGLSIHARFDEHLAPRIVCDAGRIRQVMLNLVSNAIKFTAQGGIAISVEVMETRPDRQHLFVRIVDTGIGIAPTDVERLFAPFSQAEASTTRRFGGSGLGLAISRRLIALLDGDLALESEAGVGTRVTIELDVETRPASTTADPPRYLRTPIPRDTSLFVLVAEDNPINRDLIAAQLDRLGYRHRIAVDGAEALAMLQAHPADVLLTDLHMPVMDGYALTRALREKDIALRIVAMTANAVPGEKERCLASGMDGFATKPLRLNELSELLSPLAVSDDTAFDTASAWDEKAWRDTYGDLALLPAIIHRFEVAVRDDIALLKTLETPADAAEWVHRVSGGLRVFGISPEAMFADELEQALRGADGHLAMPRLPEMAQRLEGYVIRLKDGLHRAPKT